MKIERRFTTDTAGAYGDIAFATTATDIRNPDGSVLFRNDGVQVPAGFSQTASDVMAQSFFCRGGVPAVLKAVPEDGVPDFLWRHVADLTALADLPECASSLCGFCVFSQRPPPAITKAETVVISIHLIIVGLSFMDLTHGSKHRQIFNGFDAKGLSMMRSINVGIVWSW